MRQKLSVIGQVEGSLLKQNGNWQPVQSLPLTVKASQNISEGTPGETNRIFLIAPTWTLAF